MAVFGVLAVVSLISTLSGIAAWRKFKNFKTDIGEFDGDKSPTFGYEGAKNVVTQDACVPIVLGMIRTAGVMPYREITEPKANNSIIEVACIISKGEIEDISNIKLNEIDWNDYIADNKGYQFWKGSDTQTYRQPTEHVQVRDSELVKRPEKKRQDSLAKGESDLVGGIKIS